MPVFCLHGIPLQEFPSAVSPAIHAVSGRVNDYCMRASCKKDSIITYISISI